MRQQNQTAVEFFLSNFRLSDMEQRALMVTPTFKFTTPVLGEMNYTTYHDFVSAMSNHTQMTLGNITAANDYEYNAKMDYTLVENTSSKLIEFSAQIQILFIDNLMDSLSMSYNVKKEHAEMFIQLMAPFYYKLKSD